MRLLRFEIGQWLKRPILYVALLLVVLFVYTQSGDELAHGVFSWPEPPQPGLEDSPYGVPAYGWRQDTSETAQIQRVLREMAYAAWGNPVLAPALGGLINREVLLSQEQAAMVRATLEEATGVAMEEMRTDTLASILPYGVLTQRLEALNAALGGTYFQMDPYIGDFVPRTYEDALADYGWLTGGGELTWAYARLFADYVGIALGLFSAFLAAFLLGRDKRSGAEQLIGPRPITSMRYLWAKYLGLAAPLCAFTMIMGLVPTMGAVLMRAAGHAVNGWAYLLVSAGWLLPTVLVVTALALFVSEATGSGIAAILASVVWWFASMARPGLSGPYPAWVSLIRFNWPRLLPAEWAGQIVVNRLCMVALSIALVCLAGILHERRRARGGRYV